MTREHWLKRAGVLALVMRLFVALPVTAFAQEDSRPTDARQDGETDRHVDRCRAIKARALEAIEHRLNTIDRLQEVVRSNDHVDPEHAAQLSAELSRLEASLEALAREIENAECQDLPELIREIVDDHRIYAIVVPKVHLVVAADTIVGVSERFEGVLGMIQEAIDHAAGTGYEVGQAQEFLNMAVESVRTAVALAQPIPGVVLPLGPEDWPEATEILRAAHGDVKTAVGELRSAKTSAHEAHKALREAIGSD